MLADPELTGVSKISQVSSSLVLQLYLTNISSDFVVTKATMHCVSLSENLGCLPTPQHKVVNFCLWEDTVVI